MRHGGSVANLSSDDSGTSFIEFSVVFPLSVLVILGMVDAALLMFDWSSATKATYAGARTAVVIDPVAGAARFNLSSYASQSTHSGRYCFNPANGTADSTANCPSVNVTCTGSNAGGGGSCTTGSFNKAAFDEIFRSVQDNYPYRRLDRRQVQVSYVTTNLGFVGQETFSGGTGELPMNVSVELRCLTHEFFFVGPLLGWALASLPAACAGVTADTEPGILMPPVYTTFPREDRAPN